MGLKGGGLCVLTVTCISPAHVFANATALPSAMFAQQVSLQGLHCTIIVRKAHQQSREKAVIKLHDAF